MSTTTAFQAIQTKYIGPSNVRGSRVKAISASKHTLTVSWDHALDQLDNHLAVAQALATKLGWGGEWYGGSSADGYVWVCRPHKFPEAAFTIADQQ